MPGIDGLKEFLDGTMEQGVALVILYALRRILRHFLEVTEANETFGTVFSMLKEHIFKYHLCT